MCWYSDISNNKLTKFFLLTILIGFIVPLRGYAGPSVPENMVLINPGGFMRGIDKEHPPKNNNKMSAAQGIKNALSGKLLRMRARRE